MRRDALLFAVILVGMALAILSGAQAFLAYAVGLLLGGLWFSRP